MRRATLLLLIILILGLLVFGSGLGNAVVSPVSAEQTPAVIAIDFPLTGVLPERESHAEEVTATQRSSCNALHGEVGSDGQAECESTQACGACTLCQACHPAALLDHITQRFAFSPTQAPPLHIAAVFSGIDRSPHLKPPIL